MRKIDAALMRYLGEQLINQAQSQVELGILLRKFAQELEHAQDRELDEIEQRIRDRLAAYFPGNPHYNADKGTEPNK